MNKVVETGTAYDVQKKKSIIEEVKQEVKSLLKEKAHKERQFIKDVAELDMQIKKTNLEIKLLTAQEKNKDNELKLMFMREREVEKSIADYRKLQKMKEKKQR